jgi:hypothetical protein
MTLTGAIARFGLIATVSVIVVVSTVAPLLKQPSPSVDRAALAAFAPPLAVPRDDAGPSASIPADNKPRLSASPASTVGVADASSRLVTSPELPAPEASPPTVVTMRRPTDEGAPSAAHSGAETLQPAPIRAASEPARERERAKQRNGTRAVRSGSPTYYSNDQQWASRVRPGSTPFSYNNQLGAQ